LQPAHIQGHKQQRLGRSPLDPHAGLAVPLFRDWMLLRFRRAPSTHSSSRGTSRSGVPRLAPPHPGHGCVLKF
jgi:hypothetical protein